MPGLLVINVKNLSFYPTFHCPLFSSSPLGIYYLTMFCQYTLKDTAIPRLTTYDL